MPELPEVETVKNGLKIKYHILKHGFLNRARVFLK